MPTTQSQTVPRLLQRQKPVPIRRHLSPAQRDVLLEYRGWVPILSLPKGTARLNQLMNEIYIHQVCLYELSMLHPVSKGTPLPKKECLFLPLNATEQGKFSNQGSPGHPQGKLAVPMAPVQANRSNTDRYSSGAPHACTCDKSRRGTAGGGGWSSAAFRGGGRR